MGGSWGCGSSMECDWLLVVFVLVWRGESSSIN